MCGIVYFREWAVSGLPGPFVIISVVGSGRFK